MAGDIVKVSKDAAHNMAGSTYRAVPALWDSQTTRGLAHIDLIDWSVRTDLTVERFVQGAQETRFRLLTIGSR